MGTRGTCCGLGICFCLRNSPWAGHPRPSVEFGPSLRLNTPPDRPLHTNTSPSPTGCRVCGVPGTRQPGVELRDAAWQGELAPGNGTAGGPQPVPRKVQGIAPIALRGHSSEKGEKPTLNCEPEKLTFALVLFSRAGSAHTLGVPQLGNLSRAGRRGIWGRSQLW